MDNLVKIQSFSRTKRYYFNSVSIESKYYLIVCTIDKNDEIIKLLEEIVEGGIHSEKWLIVHLKENEYLYLGDEKKRFLSNSQIVEYKSTFYNGERRLIALTMDEGCYTFDPFFYIHSIKKQLEEHCCTCPYELLDHLMKENEDCAGCQ